MGTDPHHAAGWRAGLSNLHGNGSTWPALARWRGVMALVGCCLGITLGCDRNPITTESARPRATAPSFQRVTAPVTDHVMGALSPVARHIAAALQDPRARAALVQYMKASGGERVGVDLQACDRDGALRALLAAGERRGGIANLCAAIKQMNGLTLYMDRDRLARWDSSVVPIVTAIEHPHRPLPRSFLGYRSPERIIDLPADGSLGGPILVVIAEPHPKAVRRRPRIRPEVEAIHVKADSGKHGVEGPQIVIPPQ